MILLLAIAAGLLYVFPLNVPLKATLLCISAWVGWILASLRTELDKEMIRDEAVFYLKSRRLSLAEAAQVVTPLSSFVLLCEHAVSLILLMAAIMRGTQLLIEFAYASEYPRPYLYLDDDAIKRQVSGTADVNLRDLKHVVLRPGSLTLYEKWAHHKVVFSEFEEGERLKATLLARIQALKIELREEPAVDAA